MDDKRQHISLVGPSLLIGIGIILLLDNLGYLEWDLWQLLQLWPVFLIVWGLELLLKHSLVGRILTAVILLGVIVGGLWFMGTGADPRIVNQVAYPRDDAASFIAILRPKVGRLTLQSYSDSSNLIGGTVTVPRGAQLVEDYSGGTRSRLRLDTLPSSRRYWPGQHESWDLNVDGNTLLDIEIDHGVGTMNLDLSELRLDKMVTDFGIASTSIDLPTEGNYDINIDGGIGTIMVQIPRDVAVHITVDDGLVARSLPAEYTRNGNSWTSPNYTESEDQIHITLSLGIGIITINQISVP
jgi:hypothetical protein